MRKGPISTAEKSLGPAGLSVEDCGAFEINEAFASVSLGWHSRTGANIRYGFQSMCGRCGNGNAPILELLNPATSAVPPWISRSAHLAVPIRGGSRPPRLGRVESADQVQRHVDAGRHRRR